MARVSPALLENRQFLQASPSSDISDCDTCDDCSGCDGCSSCSSCIACGRRQFLKWTYPYDGHTCLSIGVVEFFLRVQALVWASMHSLERVALLIYRQAQELVCVRLYIALIVGVESPEHSYRLLPSRTFRRPSDETVLRRNQQP